MFGYYTIWNVYTIDIRMIEYTMVIHVHTDIYRFIQKVVFGCWIPVNSDNKGITLKVLYEAWAFICLLKVYYLKI
jgi:hypothetical protein